MGRRAAAKVARSAILMVERWRGAAADRKKPEIRGEKGGGKEYLYSRKTSLRCKGSKRDRADADLL